MVFQLPPSFSLKPCIENTILGDIGITYTLRVPMTVEVKENNEVVSIFSLFRLLCIYLI